MQGMWYAGFLNLSIGFVNLAVYVMGGHWLTLTTACCSTLVGIIIFVAIKRMALRILWDKLTTK